MLAAAIAAGAAAGAGAAALSVFALDSRVPRGASGTARARQAPLHRGIVRRASVLHLPPTFSSALAATGAATAHPSAAE